MSSDEAPASGETDTARPGMLPSALGNFPPIHDLFAAVDLLWPAAVDPAHRMTHRTTTGVGLDDARTVPFNISSAVWSDVVAALDALNTFAILVREAEKVPIFACHALFRVALERLASALWHLEPAKRPERVRRMLVRAFTDLTEREQLATMLGSRKPKKMRERLQQVAESAALTLADLAAAKRSEAHNRAVFESLYRVGMGKVRHALWKAASGAMHGQQSMALMLSEHVDVGEADKTGDVYVTLTPDDRFFAIYAFVIVDDLANVMHKLERRGMRWNLDLTPLYALRTIQPEVRLGGRKSGR